MASTFPLGARVVLLDVADFAGLHRGKSTGTVVEAPRQTLLYRHLGNGSALDVPVHHPGPIPGMVAVAWDDGRRVEWEITHRLQLTDHPRPRARPRSR